MAKLLIACVCCIAVQAPGAVLLPVITLSEAGLTAIDLQGQSVVIDVYSIGINNPTDQPVVKLDLSLAASLVQANQYLGGEPELSAAFGYSIADSFFVFPQILADLPVFTFPPIDTESLLEGSFTAPEGTVLIPAGETRTVATLSLPAGTELDATRFRGSGTLDLLDGSLQAVSVAFPVPEPTAGWLACLAAVGAFAPRRDQ